jgi:hypothetical protein
MSEQVLEGLKKMDPTKDAQWTIAGEPNLATVKYLSGGVTVTRDELNALAPGFNREKMAQYIAGLAEAAKMEAGDGTENKPETAGTGAGTVAEIVNKTETDSRPKDREDEVETMAEEIARANETVLKLQRLQVKVREDLVEAETARDALIDKFVVVNPPPTHQQNVVAYLARGHKARIARAGAMRKLAELDVDDLMAKASASPIDQAMRGRKRR